MHELSLDKEKRLDHEIHVSLQLTGYAEKVNYKRTNDLTH